VNRRNIRWIDKNIGHPITFFLTLHRKLCDTVRPRVSSYKKPSRVLFIKLIEQGSTVLAYPALKRAENYAGRENLFFLVLKENRPILDIIDIIPPSNIIVVNADTVLSLLITIFRALLRMRSERIDAVIDMEFFARGSAILAYLSGAARRVGLHPFTQEGPYRGDLFTHKLLYNPYLHTKIFFLSMVEALKYPPSSGTDPMIFGVPKGIDGPPPFCPTEDEKRSLIEKIERLKKSALTKPIIILNPNIGDLLPIRRWPQENFVKLGNMIRGEYPQAVIIITGSSQEEREASAVTSKIDGAICLAGETSLRELLTLYCIADALITNDSGPALFSSLTPIKSVILFGPETPFLYGEEKAGRINVSPDLVCSPCVNAYNHRRSPCDMGTCMKNVGAEDVFEKIEIFLKGGN
jgi:ADP-heptose:LPS heptosyltransferase